MALGASMEQEILQQPQVLAENCDRYHAELCSTLDGVQPEIVVMVARGSSDHAAIFARYLLEVYLGVPVVLSAPSVMTRYGSQPKYPPGLVVGISQSGAAPDVAEVLRIMRESGHRTLAVTNTANSLLTEVAESTLLLKVGVESSIAATKTFTASLLAMVQLCRALGGGLPDPKLVLPTAEFLRECRTAAEQHVGALVGSEPVFTLGRGYAFSTALESALKLMECALIPAKGYSSADFEHGPKALAGAGSAVVVFGEPAAWMEGSGSAVVRFQCEGVAEPFRPMHEVIFGQWLALLCARAKGIDPDHARNLAKVTKTL